MSEEYPKNSLLGQLEQKGLLSDNSTEAQYLPFGILTGNSDLSPFAPQKEEEEKKQKKIIKKRLNDLDNNLFQEGNFINIEDNELNKEEKTAKIKHLIKKLDEKIFMLEDSDDEILLKKLNDEKEALQRTLALLSEEHSSVENKETDIKEKIQKFEDIIFRFCPIFKKKFLIHKALSKLIMLNESAKDLLSKKIPYGEQEGRYNDFIAYLSCANVIHAKLTKKM